MSCHDGMLDGKRMGGEGPSGNANAMLSRVEASCVADLLSCCPITPTATM